MLLDTNSTGDKDETYLFKCVLHLPSVIFPLIFCDSYCHQLMVFYGEANMLESLAIVLIILWILGLVSSYTLGGFIHILLVIAVIVIVLRIIQGRRIV